MHVLIIPSWYKTPDQPLSGTFFEEQARMLLKAGYKTGVLYPFLNSQFKLSNALKQLFSKNSPEDFDDKDLPTLYEFTNAIVPSRFQKINYWFACFRTYQKYKKYARLYGKPDVIHAHSVFIGGWVARYIANRQNIAYIFTEHTSSLLHSKWINTDKVSKDIVKTTVEDARVAVFVSNAFREQLIRGFNITHARSITVPNMANPVFYSGFTRKQKPSSFILLCIAVFGKNKQHELLFESLKIITQSGHRSVLNLIGDGEQKNQLMVSARRHGIEHLVTFMGLQPREVVKREIDNAHIIVSASRFESFGLSIIEAFACGRPVVAIDSGGPRDTVTPENGILVNENTAEKLAEGIISVMNNYENYDQEKIKEDSLKKYSEDAIFSKLKPIYEDAAIR
jgi:glycosyltransferase involved in cell wall biosynthesis